MALIWNERRLDSTPFLRAYEELLVDFGTDYSEVKHLTMTESIAKFFAPSSFKLKSFANSQQFDFVGLQGRVLSASYTPEPDHPNFTPMLSRLHELFEAHQRNGTVAFDYDTNIYYGQLDLSYVLLL